jgi:SAM-dependent methyltransferase
MPLQRLPLHTVPMQAERLNYSVRRYFVDEFFTRHVSQVAVGSQMLDLGGTRIRKRGQFAIERYDVKVIYVNLVTMKQPHIQADAADVPLLDQSCDVVICAELLEHVRHPECVLHEAFRVLRPGGTLLISVPFLYHIHGDPQDFGRYTDYFWNGALREIGFTDVAIERQGLFFSVLADFLKHYIRKVGLPAPWNRPARWLLPRFQRWALRYEQSIPVQQNAFLQSFTTGFGIVAVKT